MNLHKYGEIQSFLKSVSAAKISKVPRFRPEDDVKQKHVQHESCWIFSLYAYWYKIRQKRSSDATDRLQSFKGIEAVSRS
jgi:hypothetical protein